QTIATLENSPLGAIRVQEVIESNYKMALLNPSLASITGDSLLQQKLGGLGPAQLALLMRKLDRRGDRSMVARILRTSHLPETALSFAQERLWFLNQLE